MSTVRCFACGEMGHYVGQCPKKKKKKKQDDSAATAEELDFDTQFARDVHSPVLCQLLHHPASGGETELRTYSLIVVIQRELRLSFRGHHLQG
jgi:hypothetical protein